MNVCNSIRHPLFTTVLTDMQHLNRINEIIKSDNIIHCRTSLSISNSNFDAKLIVVTEKEVIRLSICRRFYRENQHSSMIAIPYEHTHIIRWIFDHLLPKCHGNAFKCYQWKCRIKTTAGKFKINSRYYYYRIVSLIIRVNKSSVIYVIYTV